MIISPPFLLPRNADETDEAWIHRCMPGGDPGQGAYPLSQALQWHGGMHLREPQTNAPVRAIADGDVVFWREPMPSPEGALPPDHPLGFYGGWTDNGVVVLRHTTEIGEGANANVTFFSVYMHLREIDPAVKQKSRVYRKRALGRAGQIYGKTGQIHFEIVCDDLNLQRLVGRASGALNTYANGRTDAVYGAMHFHLPAGSLVYPARPALNLSQAAGGVPIQGELFVELRYAGGEGAEGNRGDAYLSTYQPDGSPVGERLNEHDAEYNLYRDANTISQAYPANARPAPSAVYELLRFGRVIGPDALNPTNVPHWRRISHPGGVGWVNLNATNVHKFSDADFPHWMGWNLIDDSADQDSRCDSATIKSWLDVNGDGKVAPAEAMTRMGAPNVAAKLARAICKFPTEWNAASFDRRLSWIKASTEENPDPVDSANFERLRSHVETLAFWPGNTGLPENHWHWSPREFVKNFRKCGWLDKKEMAQCLPRNIQHLVGTKFVSSSFGWADAYARSSLWSLHFNKANRKYGIDRRQRLTHYFAQIVPETNYLRLMKESDSKDGSYLRGKSYYPYYGRGFIQLTWMENYKKYGEYRGFPKTEIRPATYHEVGWNPDELLVSNNDVYNASNCVDSAGYYVAAYAGMVKKMDGGVSVADAVAVSRCVNGDVAMENINGLDGRLQGLLNIRDVLLDFVADALIEKLSFTWRRNSQQEPTAKINKSGAPIKAYILRSWELDVSLVKQRP
jgi:predicted chitinase